MDIVAALRSEAKKLETQLGGIRQAIRALNGYAPRAINHMSSEISSDSGSKLRGRKLSASHRRAIKVGIAKAKARKAGGK
jgi:hypothetical protein